MRKWRVFLTAPRAEKKCEERLLDRELDAFLPKYTTLRQWKDRKKAVTEPLFRGYIFAQVDEGERIDVLKTPGIIRCLAFGGRMAEIREDEIDQLKICQKDKKRLALAEKRPSIGKEVVLLEGPLKGLRGDVEEHRGQYYVMVRIKAMNQAIRVNIPGSWLETI